MTDGVVDEIPDGLTGVDHEPIGELHALSTRSPQFSRDDDLATLGTTLHNESQDTVACTSDGKTTEELVSEGFALGDGGKTTGLNLLGVELDGVLGVLESLLDQGGEFTDAATLLSKNFLSVGGTDDDL